MWIGSNDVFDILADRSLTTAQQNSDVVDAVANEMNAVGKLVADGAKQLLVADVPDLGKTPEITVGLINGSDTPRLHTSAATYQFRYALLAGLQAIPERFRPLSGGWKCVVSFPTISALQGARIGG